MKAMKLAYQNKLVPKYLVSFPKDMLVITMKQLFNKLVSEQKPNLAQPY